MHFHRDKPDSKLRQVSLEPFLSNTMLSNLKERMHAILKANKDTDHSK